MLFSSWATAEVEVVERGFKAFKEKGVKEAWLEWTRYGPMEGSKEIVAQSSRFGQISAYYGDYVDHEYVALKDITKKNKVAYIVMNMESGPLYMTFFLYKLPSGKWTAPNFQFHTQAYQIWPANLYSTCGD